MTDLSKVLKAVKESKIVLDAEFWDRQNKQLSDNMGRFEREARELIPTNELMNRRFNL